MRVKHFAAAPLLCLLLAGCAQEEPRAVPDVRGERLDVAERRLDDAGLEYERIGGGALGIVVRSNWRVCDQEPGPGRRATRVRLIVDRHCPAPPRPTFFVPDLTGERLEHARARLDARQIPYRVVGPRAGDPLVCSQQPPGGQRAAEAVLHVAASCGPPPAPVLPDVVLLDLGEAEELLRDRGVLVRVTSSEPAIEPFFDVCAQHPPAGARARAVTLTVERRC